MLLIKRDEAGRIRSQQILEHRNSPANEALAGLRAAGMEEQCLHGIIFRERDRSVRLLGRDVALSFVGFELLRFLAERHPDVVSKREIAARLGTRTPANYDSSARSYIGYLRGELKSAGLARVVVNERWLGYRLDLPPIPENAPPDGGAEPGPS